MIPLFVECSGKRIVIFGGGDVAARKAGHFAREADVLVVSKSFGAGCKALPVKLQQLDTRNSSNNELALLITSAFLVVGALSDQEENNRIGTICKEHGVLFNNASGISGDVILPAMSIGEHHTIAVSTGSESPAVSRFIRQEIERQYPALDAMVILQGHLRQALKKQMTTPDMRRRILREVLKDKTIWSLLIKSPEKAWEMVSERYLNE